MCNFGHCFQRVTGLGTTFPPFFVDAELYLCEFIENLLLTLLETKDLARVNVIR
jgi:hypothetical protein